MQNEESQISQSIIRTMVRSIYDLQKMRIQMGNRITTNFKSKLGLTQDGMSERELDAQAKKVLTMLRDSYIRITDGIVFEGKEIFRSDENPDNTAIISGRLPSFKKFKGDEVISSYAELVLIDQYMMLLSEENKNFDRLDYVLQGIPVYDKFLSGIQGIGPAMAGVLISEIDISKANYPSSLWKLSGLDSVTVGKYTDKDGKTKYLPEWEIQSYFENREIGEPMIYNGYEVEVTTVGRSKRDFCLEDRVYINKDGEEATRKSITFNPFLKTKLVGVLGGSFLKMGSVCEIDGVKISNGARMKLAKDKGFVVDTKSTESPASQVVAFLRDNGFSVNIIQGTYSRRYYEYKQRLENDPRHKEKTPAHRHAMAIRFMVKRFLVDYYKAARELAGLEVHPEYSEGKLGMIHKQQAA